MRWHACPAIVAFVTFGVASRLPHPRSHSIIGHDHEQLKSEFFASGQLSITKLAALGDSYSAGIGAGNRLGNSSSIDDDSDWACSRYDHAYAYLINKDERLGDPTKRTFQFASCSGATMGDIINKQIPSIDQGQQVILISAGLTDAHFVEVLNQCVFQWNAVNSEHVAAAKLAIGNKDSSWSESLDWDSLSRSCEEQLAHAEAFISSDDFSNSLDLLLATAKEKLAPGGKIFYTGYAKFWADDYTQDCDQVSWSAWNYKMPNMFQPRHNLTSSIRREMNNQIDMINTKISDAVAKAGSSAEFVNYDAYVGDWKGRFCETGVDETAVEGSTRLGLMFYEPNTLDLFSPDPWVQTPVGIKPRTFEGTLEAFLNVSLLLDVDAKLVRKRTIQDLPHSTYRDVDFLSHGHARVFHPRPVLQSIIANSVIYYMENMGNSNHGFGSIRPRDLDYDLADMSCPVPGGGGGGGGATGQQLAIASYINPLADPGAWNRLIGYPKEKLSVLVANVVNGPDYEKNTNWASVIDRAHAAGKKVIGYVRTGYLGVSQQKFKTRLGSTALADWAAQIERDVDRWYELYGSSIDGIFFDEGWPECGPNNIYSELYKYINDNTKIKHPGAFTVLNPGSPMASCYEQTMDTLLTFELSYEAYTQNYVGNDWVAKDPRKIWHIIYNVPEAEVGKVAALAKERGAGMLHITNDVMPNPYDNLPSDSYMQAQLNAVEGGTPNNEDPKDPSGDGGEPSAPSGLQVVSSDYSSVHLKWSPTANAIGYSLQLMGGGPDVNPFINVPASMTDIVVGSLNWGQSYTFGVVASGANRADSQLSNLVTFNTKSLPAAGPIADYTASPSSGSTTYKANILIPYAFVRLYIWDSVECDWDTSPGWPVNFKTDDYVCTHYMVEGETLYKYTGTNPGGTGNAPWSWATVGPVTVSSEGYAYTWTLPIGTLTTDTSRFVVEVQGYGPLTRVFSPQPSDYDCKGSSMCGTPDLLKWCDHASNSLQRNDDLAYATFGDHKDGNCWGDGVRGCGVFIKGDNCAISGNNLWWAYQNIRKIGGCKKCGAWHRADGCQVRVDYVYNCENS